MTDRRNTLSSSSSAAAGGGKRGLPSRRIEPAALAAAARAVAPHAPPATARPSDATAMLSVRMKESTLEALAREALRSGLSQRRIIAEALAARGLPVAAADLEDRPRARRRGGGG